MGKKIIMCVLVGAVMIAAASAATENKGSDKITLNGGNKGDVNFPHYIHQNTLGDCTKCHTLFPLKANAIEDLKTAGILKKKQVMKQCRNCHKQLAKAGQKAGPVSCKKCHQKKTS